MVFMPHAACPGGEEDDLKSFDPKGFAGSNPVCGVVADSNHSKLIIL